MTGEFQCEENSFCNNSIGNYSCVCNDGYERTDNGSTCSVIDSDERFDSVLLLHQQTAVLRSLEGEVLDFDYSVDDDSWAEGYCSITFKNEHFILG